MGPVIYWTTESVMEVADDEARKKLEQAEANLLKAVQGHEAWIVPAKRAAFLAKLADPQVQIRRPKGEIGNVHPGAVGHYLIAACALRWSQSTHAHHDAVGEARRHASAVVTRHAAAV